MLIDGIHIPLTLPFTRDGDLYLRKLEYNVARYSLGPASAFVALTSAAEADTLSDAETADVLHAISATAAPEKVLLAEISRPSVRGALAIAAIAEAANFDVVLLSAPTSSHLTPAERLLYFLAVADRSPLPVVLVNSVAARHLTIEQIAELSHHPNIIGLYDEALTPDRFQVIAASTQHVQRSVTVTSVFAPVTRRMHISAAPASGLIHADSLTSGTKATLPAATIPPQTSSLKTRAKTVGFQVMAAGSTLHLVELLAAGVAGAMPAMSACAPQACHEAYAAFKDGDAALAAEKAYRLIAADAALADVGIAGIKYGCDLNGYYGGGPRLPRLPLDAPARAVIEQSLHSMRN
ncbi:MAG: dihydrodipicolinate synthase family protein [Acidobacteria bacterium]|nr:dihydrodipicolinate synthase family protein [Acidobacteriota bacterium]